MFHLFLEKILLEIVLFAKNKSLFVFKTRVVGRLMNIVRLLVSSKIATKIKHAIAIDNNEFRQDDSTWV